MSGTMNGGNRGANETELDAERCETCGRDLFASNPSRRSETPDDRFAVFSDRFCSAGCYHAYGATFLGLVRVAAA